MIRRVLIANRGEIAVRIIRACRELGIETVVAYSEADRESQAVRMADHGICIGPPPALKSYLDIARIISAAEVTDADAIHPGYGFLSENAHFAEICRQCHIPFIGPPPEAMHITGDKVRARELARKLKIPTVPGSDGAVPDEAAAVEIARRIGYPVLVKAAAGGGGRGIRVAHNDISLRANFAAAQAEAAAAFKDGTLYIEKYVERPRHVEVQILADQDGTTIHLGERDCSVQRRHQKLIEEAPSPAVTPALRKDLGAAAVSFARAAGYVNAGTVEFLLDERGRFYFIEMNARLQVEHPVTEMVTGVDLVHEQLRIASGERLRFGQREIRMEGAAIECRVNAEDPSDGFRPCPGRVQRFSPPGGPGVRVDTHLESGANIPPYYDSMVAKLIVHAPDRAQAVARLRRALREFLIEGVATTIPLYLAIVEDARYIQGQVDTTFLETRATG